MLDFMICDGCNTDVEKTIPNKINGKWYNLGKCCFLKFRDKKFLDKWKRMKDNLMGV